MTQSEIVDGDAIEIGELYSTGCNSVVGSAHHYAKCGLRLIEKRAELRVDWESWLRRNETILGFGRRAAQMMMRASRAFPQLASDIQPVDNEMAIQFLQRLWGHGNPKLAIESETYQAEIEAGCTVDDLDALAKSGKRFGVIYADPPWQFRVYSGKGKSRSADRRYDTSSIDEIKNLPVQPLTSDDCALFLWCVMPEIPGALEVIKAWGFEYKTVAFTWVKQNKSGEGLFWGMGYWTRANAELCLLATKGSPKRLDKGVHQVIQCPVGEHSRKPDEAQVRIERLVSGPYLELYGRRAAPGWWVWGNQIERNLLTQQIQEFAA